MIFVIICVIAAAFAWAVVGPWAAVVVLGLMVAGLIADLVIAELRERRRARDNARRI